MNRQQRRAAKAEAKANADEKAKSVAKAHIIQPKAAPPPMQPKSSKPSRSLRHKLSTGLVNWTRKVRRGAKCLFLEIKKRWDLIAFLIQFSSSLVSLFGFVFLLVDLRFQTEPSISSPASDPQNPFMYPFAVTNNSHMFSVYDVTWACDIVHMQIGGSTFDDVTAIMQTEIPPPIKPGQVVNVDCRRTILAPTGSISSVVLAINISYTMYFLGFIPWRSHQKADFTWYAQATNPQWIRGLVAK